MTTHSHVESRSSGQWSRIPTLRLLTVSAVRDAVDTQVSSIAPSSSEVLLNGTLEMFEKNKRRFLAVLRSLKSGDLWLGLYGSKTDNMKATMVEHSVARWIRGSSGLRPSPTPNWTTYKSTLNSCLFP